MPFWENWHGSAATKLFQVVAGLPAENTGPK